MPSSSGEEQDFAGDMVGDELLNSTALSPGSEAQAQCQLPDEVSQVYLNQARASSFHRSYDSISLVGSSKAIFGDIHGGIHYHVRPPHAIIELSNESNQPRAPRKEVTFAESDTAGPGDKYDEQDSATAFPSWLRSFEQRDDFIGRKTELEELESKLFAPETFGRVALTGLGGTGKSRLAIEIAHRTKRKRPLCSIFWIQATDLSSVQRGFRDIARALQLPVTASTEAERLEVVRQRLSQEEMGEWLLILDDADDDNLWVRRTPGDSSSAPPLTDYVPQNARGAVLITTRCRHVAVRIAQTRIVPLRQLNLEDAIKLFERHLNHPTLEQKTSTHKLAQFLTRLPLALIRAADFVNETDFEVSTLVALLQENEEAVVELLGTDVEEEKDPTNATPFIKTTWLVSVNRIRRQDKHAFDLLAFIACINHEKIPISILPTTQTSFHQARALALLMGYGLLLKREDIETGEASFKMHWLAYLAVRSWLRQSDTLKKKLLMATFHVIDLLRRTPISNLTDSVSAMYLFHIQHLCSQPENTGIQERFDLLRLARLLLKTQDDHEQSLSCWQQLATDVGKGPTPPAFDIAYFYGWIGHVLYANQFWTKAEPYLKHAELYLQKAQTFQTAEVNNEVNRGTVMTELIRTYQHLRQPVKAASLAVRLVEDNIAHFGNMDHRTSDALSIWLGVSVQKEWISGHQSFEREEVLSKLVNALSWVIGANHVATAEAKCKLAACYYASSRRNEGDNLLHQAIEVFEEVLGIDHHQTLFAKTILAIQYSNDCQWEKVDLLFKQSLPSTRVAYEWDARYAAFTRAIIAHCYAGRGYKREAAQLVFELLELPDEELWGFSLLSILAGVISRLGPLNSYSNMPLTGHRGGIYSPNPPYSLHMFLSGLEQSEHFQNDQLFLFALRDVLEKRFSENFTETFLQQLSTVLLNVEIVRGAEEARKYQEQQKELAAEQERRLAREAKEQRVAQEVQARKEEDQRVAYEEQRRKQREFLPWVKLSNSLRRSLKATPVKDVAMPGSNVNNSNQMPTPSGQERGWRYG